ncbi:MAG: DUF2336 domain-containing protein [Pseudomonadota bacterium]
MADWTNVDQGGSFSEPGGAAAEPSVEVYFAESASSGLPAAETLEGPQLDRQAIDCLAREALAAHLQVSPYLPPSMADSLVDAVSSAPGACDDAQATPAGHPLEKLLSSFSAPASHDKTPPNEFLSLGVGYHQLCLISEQLRDELVELHRIPLRLADEMVRHSQEGAVCHLLMSRHNARELQALTVSLHGKGAITPTLLLRSLCYGQLGFLEAALAVMARVPSTQASLLIATGRPEELLRLYEQAGLPIALFRAFRGAVEVIKIEREAGTRARPNGSRSALCDRIIARWVKDYEDICPEGLDYVMTQFARFCDPKRRGQERVLVRAS